MRSWALCRVILLTTGAFFAACDAGPLVISPESAQPGLPAGGASSSPLGHIIFSRGGPSAGLYEMNPDGTNVRKLTHRSGDTAATWSPDGSRIAFGDENISVMNADGTERMRLTNDGASSNPTWSPDGARIAFARETLGTADIYVMQADGSGVTRLTNDRLREYTPAWSPDGSTIALVGYAQGASGPPSPVRLYLMNANGTGLRPLGPNNVAQPSFSPDGTKLAFVGKGSLYVINADGTGLRRVVNLEELTLGRWNLTNSPTWSPDGTKIAFASGRKAISTHIYVVDLDGSGLVRLTNSPAPDAYPDWR